METVNHPAHYGGDTVYEVIKVIRAWGLGFALGNAVKYIARAGKKDGPTFNHDRADSPRTPCPLCLAGLRKQVEDLKKARWYVTNEIDELRKQYGPHIEES